MIPLFPDSQTRDERVYLIREAIDPKVHSAEQLEGELTTLFQSCGKPLVLTRVTYDPRLSEKAGRAVLPIIVYDAGEADFRAEPDDPDRKHSQMITAPMISHGLLVDLLEMNQIRRILGIAISGELATSFRNCHLTAIQEFLALGIWRNPSGIVRNYRATAGKKDVDWQFAVGSMPVLLEVKFRRTDWRRGHPETVTFNLPRLFAEIGEKFPDANAGFLRVAHVVLIQPIDGGVYQAAQDFAASAMVDAVILQPLNEAGGAQVAVLGKSADFVRAQIRESRTFHRPGVIPIIFRRPSR